MPHDSLETSFSQRSCSCGSQHPCLGQRRDPPLQPPVREAPEAWWRAPLRSSLWMVSPAGVRPRDVSGVHGRRTTLASSPAQRGDRKRVWGPQKEAEEAPPALGKEAPTPPHHHRRPAAQSTEISRAFWFPFPFTKTWVGDFQQRPAWLAGAASWCPGRPPWGPAGLWPSPKTAARDPPPGCGALSGGSTLCPC